MDSNALIIFVSLVIVLIMLIKGIIDCIETNKELKKAIKDLEKAKELEKQVKYETKKKKEQIDTSDDNVNFNNSIDILSKYANRK